MTMQLFSGMEYLKIDIANNFGNNLDKENWDTRIHWFNNHELQLDNLIKQAEEPALFYAGVQAWHKASRGEASGYPISLDATSSGIQLLACLTGDRKAAQLCNVVDTGKREDAYVGLYQSMINKLGDTAKIDRKETKQAIMTSFYNSSAIPKKIFGEGKLLDIFYETMAEEAPGAWELTETMLAIWDSSKLIYEWVMPDNFHVKIKVMAGVSENIHFLNQPFEVYYTVNEPMEGGRSLGANGTHSIDGMLVREMERRCNYNPERWHDIENIIGDEDYKDITPSRNRENDKTVLTLWDHYLDSGFLSARIMEYLDINNMGLINPKAIQFLLDNRPIKPFEVLSIHDCFRCLPNYGNDLRRQYNILLAEIAQSNLLSFIISQMVGRIIPVTKLDNNLYKDILLANYALS